MTIERYREPQAVGLRHGEQKEWTSEGNRKRECALVAVDGICTRKKAERMSVRKSGLKQPIWVAPRYKISSRRTELSVFRVLF